MPSSSHTARLATLAALARLCSFCAATASASKSAGDFKKSLAGFQSSSILLEIIIHQSISIHTHARSERNSQTKVPDIDYGVALADRVMMAGEGR